jgi:hypothetical protein
MEYFDELMKAYFESEKLKYRKLKLFLKELLKRKNKYSPLAPRQSNSSIFRRKKND